MAKRTKRDQYSMAAKADVHVLYQKSVQSTEFEIEFYEDRFREIRGKRKKPMSLREDFCGTGLLVTDWCKSSRKRTAIGVDLCMDTLDWALENNVKPAGISVGKRVKLLNKDVLKVKTEKVDVICAMNFSFCIFESRKLLKAYFTNVRKGLNERGLFFCDLMGGSNTIDDVEEERQLEGENASYIWEQTNYNPINHHLDCFIHFDFDDGSQLKKAFSYSWRLWSIPEIHELLLEAGFAKVRVYWEEFVEDNDPKNDYMEGTGNYREVLEVPQQESWLAYIVAEI